MKMPTTHGWMDGSIDSARTHGHSTFLNAAALVFIMQLYIVLQKN
jgi:hypothetical protein